MTLPTHSFAALGLASWRDQPIPMAMVADTGKLLDVNPAACRMWQRSREELLAGTWQDITDPAYVRVDEEQVRNVITGEAVGYVLEKVYTAPNSDLIYATLYVTRVIEPTPHEPWLLATIIDNTKSRRALRDAQARAADLAQQLAELQQTHRILLGERLAELTDPGVPGGAD